MINIHPVDDHCSRIHVTTQPPFTDPMSVSKPIRPGECREERADRLRRWCSENCLGRWQPLERWTEDSVRIEFEDHIDALLYWLLD